MNLPRRRFLHLAAGAAVVSALPRIAAAQAYPAKPVRVIVGFGAGSAADIVSRLISQRISERLGQPFVIENRPGAGGNIATEAVVHAAPDGYTLLQVGTANAINATLYDKLNYNFIRDIAPVAGMITLPNVMVVNRSVPAQTVPEFITYAKNNPDDVNMASLGIGTAPHVAGELFNLMAGVHMVNVPYRGGAGAMADLLSGKVQVYFASMATAIEHVRTGELRALAVTTTTRSDTLPDVPTVSEFLPGYEANVWFGIGAPRNTDAAIINRLNQEINAALADPKIKAQFNDLGGIALSGPPAAFGRLIAEETEKWGQVSRIANIKPG